MTHHQAALCPDLWNSMDLQDGKRECWQGPHRPETGQVYQCSINHKHRAAKPWSKWQHTTLRDIICSEMLTRLLTSVSTCLCHCYTVYSTVSQTVYTAVCFSHLPASYALLLCRRHAKPTTATASR